MMLPLRKMSSTTKGPSLLEGYNRKSERKQIMGLRHFNKEKVIEEDLNS